MRRRSGACTMMYAEYINYSDAGENPHYLSLHASIHRLHHGPISSSSISDDES
jgi:hypothetical protein